MSSTNPQDDMTLHSALDLLSARWQLVDEQVEAVLNDIAADLGAPLHDLAALDVRASKR
jgi:hypothetical protein